MSSSATAWSPGRITGVFFSVHDATGDDIVDGSAVTNGTPLAFYSCGGTDTFYGGTDDDLFGFNRGTLTSADMVSTAAPASTPSSSAWRAALEPAVSADFAGASGIEIVVLGDGGEVTLADNLTGGPTLRAIGSGALDMFDGGAITGHSILFTGLGGTDILKGGALNDIFYVPDSDFVLIDGNGGNADRIQFTTAEQIFDVTANASKISDVEVLWLDHSNSNHITVTLEGNDIPLISAIENYLYIVGSGDDEVFAGDGWTLLETNHQNLAIAPASYTFNHFMHTNGSHLYVADQITAAISFSADQPADLLLHA